MLGIKDEFNMCSGSLDEVKQFSHLILQHVYLPLLRRQGSATGIHMSSSIATSLESLFPLKISFDPSLLSLCDAYNIEDEFRPRLTTFADKLTYRSLNFIFSLHSTWCLKLLGRQMIKLLDRAKADQTRVAKKLEQKHSQVLYSLEKYIQDEHEGQLKLLHESDIQARGKCPFSRAQWTAINSPRFYYDCWQNLFNRRLLVQVRRRVKWSKTFDSSQWQLKTLSCHERESTLMSIVTNYCVDLLFSTVQNQSHKKRLNGFYWQFTGASVHPPRSFYVVGVKRGKAREDEHYAEGQKHRSSPFSPARSAHCQECLQNTWGTLRKLHLTSYSAHCRLSVDIGIYQRTWSVYRTGVKKILSTHTPVR